MKKSTINRIFILAIILTSALGSCTGNHGSSINDDRDSTKVNHATEPAEPSAQEYPGSKLNDSLYHSDSTRH